MDVSISFFCASKDCKIHRFWLNIPMRKTSYIESNGAQKRGGEIARSTVRHMIAMASEIAEQKLLSQSAEILNRINALGETFSDIARAMIPEVTQHSLNLGQMAVARAVRELFSEDEYAVLAAKNKLKGASKGGSSFHPVGFDPRKEKFTPNGHRPLWPDEELQALKEMKADQTGAYLYKGGLHDGRPSFTYIASLLNERFRDIRPSRTANACKRMWDRLVESDGNEESLAQ